MLRVTEEALDLLEQMRDANNAEENEGVLIFAGPQGELGMALSVPGEFDQVVERNGRVVVIVASNLAEILEGLTLDVEEGPEGTELHFHRA
ncbi:MAG: adhesin [Chloroflexota bacterium]|jgi:Fe-S cluster assembly iron-binding protein IscA